MMRCWVNPESRRYYNALLQPDLFGRWSLMRNWGCLDNGRGQLRIETVGDPATGQQLMDAINKRRLAHGYSPVRGWP